jgi:hypothetical protein
MPSVVKNGFFLLPGGARAVGVLQGLALLGAVADVRAGELAILLGTSEPVGEFADSNDPRMGFGGGIEADWDISPAATWTASACLLVNRLGEPAGWDHGSWVNLPLMTGPRIQAGHARAGGYVQAQVGMNLGTQTESTNGYLSARMDWAASPAMGAGVGLFAGIFHIGFRYYHLGEPEHTLTLSGGDFRDKSTGDVSKSVIHLFIGMRFGQARTDPSKHQKVRPHAAFFDDPRTLP